MWVLHAGVTYVCTFVRYVFVSLSELLLHVQVCVHLRELLIGVSPHSVCFVYYVYCMFVYVTSGALSTFDRSARKPHSLAQISLAHTCNLFIATYNIVPGSAVTFPCCMVAVLGDPLPLSLLLQRRPVHLLGKRSSTDLRLLSSFG